MRVSALLEAAANSTHSLMETTAAAVATIMPSPWRVAISEASPSTVPGPIGTAWNSLSVGKSSLTRLHDHIAALPPPTESLVPALAHSASPGRIDNALYSALG